MNTSILYGVAIVPTVDAPAVRIVREYKRVSSFISAE